jgi:hypothetical protein
VLNSYRHAVSKQIPKATRVAWTLKKDEIQKDAPGITKKRFLYNLSRASYEKQWGVKLSKTDILGKVSGVSIQTGTQNWTSPSDAIPHTHPRDRKNA